MTHAMIPESMNSWLLFPPRQTPGQAVRQSFSGASAFHFRSSPPPFPTCPSCPALAIVERGSPIFGAHDTSRTQSECPGRASSSCHRPVASAHLQICGQLKQPRHVRRGWFQWTCYQHRNSPTPAMALQFYGCTGCGQKMLGCPSDAH